MDPDPSLPQTAGARGATPVVGLPARCLVVLVGPSAAGKSTWASAAFRDGQVVSSDRLRAAVGESRHDQRASADAFRLLDQIIDLRLGRGLLTVIDTLGLDATRRGGWVSRAHDADMPVIAVRFTVVPATVRARNKATQRPVPAAVLSRQLREHAATTVEVLRAEGFDDVIELDTTPSQPPSPTPSSSSLPGPSRPSTSLPGPSLPSSSPSDPPGSAQATQPASTPAGRAPATPAVVLTPRSVTATAPLAATQLAQPMTMRFGLQIGRFDAPPGQLRRHLVEIAQAAEAAGFHSLWVMDHVIQIPQVGREWDAMLESYATLSFLAGVTRRIRLGALVTAVTFRNLAHLAKVVASLDVLSGGRAICGLGAAWYQREHTVYGWQLPPVARRYDLLRDACELLPLMWGPGSPAFEGRTTTVPQAICYPRPVQDRIPILVGGSGERSTLRLVAQHADACNLFGDPAVVARRVAVLHAHCAEVGRDPATIEITNLATVLSAPGAATLAQRVQALTPRGRAPEGTVERLDAATVDQQIGRFRAYADAGVQTAIITMPVIDAGRVAELAPLVAAFS